MEVNCDLAWCINYERFAIHLKKLPLCKVHDNMIGLVHVGPHAQDPHGVTKATSCEDLKLAITWAYIFKISSREYILASTIRVNVSERELSYSAMERIDQRITSSGGVIVLLRSEVSHLKVWKQRSARAARGGCVHSVTCHSTATSEDALPTRVPPSKSYALRGLGIHAN